MTDGFSTEGALDLGFMSLPEPVQRAAEHGAVISQLRERIARLENERAGKVIVDRQDLRVALDYAAHFDVADDPAIVRLTEVARQQ